MSNNKDTAITLRKENELRSTRRSFISMGTIYPIIHLTLQSINPDFELPVIGLFLFPILFFGAYFLINRNSWVRNNLLDIRFTLFFIQMIYLAYLLYISNFSQDFGFNYWVYLLILSNTLMTRSRLIYFISINFFIVIAVALLVGDTPEVPVMISILWNSVVFFFIFLTMDTKIKRETLLLQSQEELYRQKSETENLLDSISAMISYKDTNNRILRVNQPFADFMGKPTEFFNGVSLYDIVPKGNAHAYHEEDLQIIRTGESIYNLVEEVLTPLGERRWLRSDKKPYLNADGKILGVVIFSVDITRQIEVERRLKQREELFRRVFDEAPYGVLIMDLGKKILHTNRALGKQLDYEEDELNALALNDLTKNAENEKADLLFESLSPLQTYANDEVKLKKKNGEILSINLFATQIKDENDIPLFYLGMIENISEKRQAEAKLEEYSKSLEESNRDLEQFGYIISHDLKEPLRMITSYTQLLKARYSKNFDERGEEFMDYVIDGSKRMNSLINDLLSYSKVGRENKVKEYVDANVIINIVQNNLRMLIYENEAIIEVNDVIPKIYCNQLQITALFQNLISNAIKYRKKDTTPRIEIGVKRKYKFWEFYIKDNGIGIAKEHLDSIFVIFQRLHAKHEYSGTGVGLAISKRIVQTHNGEIWAHSIEGGGSTFYFTIPIE